MTIEYVIHAGEQSLAEMREAFFKRLDSFTQTELLKFLADFSVGAKEELKRPANEGDVQGMAVCVGLVHLKKWVAEWAANME